MANIISKLAAETHNDLRDLPPTIISTCGTCGRKVRDLHERIDIEWYSDTECGPCGRERIMEST